MYYVKQCKIKFTFVLTNRQNTQPNYYQPL